jgi:hypothetical protein
MQWKPEHDVAAAQMRADGFSASETSVKLFKQFGIDVSRNAVCGRWDRLKLPRPDGQQKNGNARKISEPKPKAAPIRTTPFWPIPPPLSAAPSPPPVQPVPQGKHAVPLLDVAPTGCRWPYSDGDGPFTFCNLPQEGWPYCQFHHRLAVRPRN